MSIFSVFVFACGATDELRTIPRVAQPEISSLLQSAMSIDSHNIAIDAATSDVHQELSPASQVQESMHSSIHSRAVDVAGALFEVRHKPARASQMVEDFVSSINDIDMTLDNDTWKVIGDINTTLQKTIKKTILDDHDLDHDALANEISNATSACTKQFSDGKTSDKEEGVQATGQGATHRTLKESLKSAISNRTNYCDKMKSTVNGVPQYSCEPPTPPSDDEKLKNSQVVEDYLQKLELAVTALNLFEAEKQSCVANIDTQKKASKSSTDMQVQFETAMCSWRIASLSTCFFYDECYKTLKGNLFSNDHWLKARIQHRHLEWETVHRIQCMLNVLIKDTKKATHEQRKKMLADCRSVAVDVSHLNITVPELPVQQKCNLSAVATYPGTADFKDAWYKDASGNYYPDLGTIAACNIPPKFQTVIQQYESTTTSTTTQACAVMAYCDSGVSFTSTNNPCGPYSSASWTDTCNCIDTVIVPTGCSIEVASSTGGGGNKWNSPYSSNVAALREGIGYDKIRSIRVFQAPPAPYYQRLYTDGVCETGAIDSKEECETAVKSLGLNFAGAYTRSNWESGCFRYIANNGDDAYYNELSTALSNRDADAAICRSQA